MSKVEKLQELYNNRFKEKDLPGIDFYELYVAVSQSPMTVDAIHSVYNVLKTINPTLSPSELINQANDIIIHMEGFMDELKELSDSTAQGLTAEFEYRRQDLVAQKSNLVSQIDSLKKELFAVETELNSIDQRKSEKTKEIQETLQNGNIIHEVFVNKVKQIIQVLDEKL